MRTAFSTLNTGESPQRRRRIHLVTDFRGECAGQVSFEREGLRGYFTEGGTPWKGAASHAERSSGAADSHGNGGDVKQYSASGGDVAACLYAAYGTKWNGNGGAYNGENFVIEERDPISVATARSGAEMAENSICPTVTAAAGMSGSNQSMVCYKAAGFKAGQGVKARSIGWGEEKCPTLAAEAGGNSVPTVCVKEQRLFENHSQDSRYKGPLDASPTIPSQLGTGGNNTPFVVEKISPVYCLQGNGIDRADTAGCNGKGVKENICYTLNTIDRPAVAFAMQALCYAEPYQKVTGPLMANSHPGSYSGQDAYSDMLVVEKERPIVFDKEVYNSGENADGGHYISEGGPAPTIRSTGHPPGVCCRYIVRRLTPTECARLQGFADRWGDIDAKDDFTEDEYRFWLDVRNTHAAINGKTVKEYTKAQMLTWYNKLRTDSSEYKMWGNGIALPPALYCMQGIMDALEGNSNEKY